MDAQSYPGRGLSLSQLVFALNQELKRAAYSPSFAFDDVSRLDQDASIALATIREWRNSFIRINRIPLDILSLIPTHLRSQKDRLHASFVCRHWRRTLVQRAELWSELTLSNGEAYVKTFLERAKGSNLNIIVDRGVPVSTMTMLSPHTNRIRYLYFLCDGWANIQKFLEINSGSLPLLHTLTIRKSDGLGTNSVPPPLFSGAVNLRVFRFHSRSSWSPSFTPFIFPNLVSFDFSTRPSEPFRTSRLLDFLEASPMLRMVRMKVFARISFEGVPPERVVTLPNVKNFDLIVNDGGPGYEIATHISCPSARFTSLVHKKDIDYTIPDEIFPAPASWNAIVRQYTRSPIEEVTLEIKTALLITCKLTFRYAGATLINLCFEVVDEDNFGFYLPSEEIQDELLTQSVRTVQNHPQLPDIRRLHVCHSFRALCAVKPSHIAGEIGRLLTSVGPLDQLTIYRCDLRPYFDPFPIFPEDYIDEPVVFPPIKEFTISHPECSSDEQCKETVVGLAKSQHTLGVPFERMVIRRESMPLGMEEGLRPWVGSVEYCNEQRCESR